MNNTNADYHQFCINWLNAWTGNKPAKLLAFYAEDAFYSDPANPAGLNGVAQMSKYFEKLLAKNPEWIWTPLEIFNTEKGFTLKWEAVIPVKEKQLVISGLDIVELTGDRITRNEVYFDRTPWLQLVTG